MVHSTSAKQRAATVLAGLALVALLSGCAGRGQRDGDRVAEWIDGQPFVTSADASVSGDAMSPGASFTMTLDSAISDEQIAELAASAGRKVREAGWPHADLVWQLGDERSFSNRGGSATMLIFFGMRHEPRYLTASARGTGDCGQFFCVTIADSDADRLLAEVEQLLELAEEAGGVQSNLDFQAMSADGRYRVTAEPVAPVEMAVALWKQIAAEVPLETAWAWVIPPIGELPASQRLTLTVADEAARDAVEQLAVRQSEVEVRVSVLGAE
jgi:hypothetical protein